MADKQGSSRRETSGKHAGNRQSEFIHCDKCGEDYSSTYKRCPFCDERPGKGGYISGKRVMEGNYPRPVNPVQIVGLVISMILIIVALFIVLTKVAPLFTRSASSSNSASSSASTSVSSSSASSSADQSGEQSSAASSVYLPTQAISLSRSDFTLSANETYQILVSVSPTEGAEPVTWTSSDTSVATVDENGNVTNVNASASKGTVTITAASGGLSASCTVRCNPGSTGGSATTESGNTGSGTTTTTITGQRTGTVVNAGSAGLNIRSGPGSSYEVVASAANGATLTIVEDAGNGWYKVSYGGGKTGYVSSSYVSVK
jgi:hypothetical protein